VIAKEGLPGLKWPILPGHHVDRKWATSMPILSS
jgi:hypothetical protein